MSAHSTSRVLQPNILGKRCTIAKIIRYMLHQIGAVHTPKRGLRIFMDGQYSTLGEVYDLPDIGICLVRSSTYIKKRCMYFQGGVSFTLGDGEVYD